MIRSRLPPRLRACMRISSLHISAGKEGCVPNSSFNFSWSFICSCFLRLGCGADGCAGSAIAAGLTIHGRGEIGKHANSRCRRFRGECLHKEQVNTSTDVDGTYRLPIPADGRYTVGYRWRPSLPARRMSCSMQRIRICKPILNSFCCHERVRRHRTAASDRRKTRLSESFCVSSAIRTRFLEQFHERRCAIRDAGSRNCIGQRDRIGGDFGKHFQLVQCHER